MAESTAKSTLPIGKEIPQDAKVLGQRKKPVRKTYQHVLTNTDKFALRSVQRAADACRQLSEAIKTGKPVKAEAVNICSQLVQATADMIFTE